MYFCVKIFLLSFFCTLAIVSEGESTNAFVRTSPLELGMRVANADWRTPLPGYEKEVESPLPIVNIRVKDDLFFASNGGIYVPGDLYTRAGYGKNRWGKPNANYYSKTEVPAIFSITEHGATSPSFSASVIVEPHGGGTRALPQKALKCTLDKTSPYVGKLFADQGVKSYRSFVLRANGNDWYGPLSDGVSTMMRDAVFNRIVGSLDIGGMAYRPVSVRINGEYWGIHNLREVINKHYFQTRYNVDKDVVEILSHEEANKERTKIKYDVKQGKKKLAKDFKAMLDHFATLDPTQDASIATIEELVDLDNFTDYVIAECFFANSDWPYNNIDFWRAPDPRAGKYGDGRWRYVIYDLDQAGLKVHGAGGADFDMFAYLKSGNVSDTENPAFLINLLWQNKAYRKRFKARALELLHTIFSAEKTNFYVNDGKSTISAEIERHFLRWGRSYTRAQWEKAVQTAITDFLNTRREVFARGIDKHFKED